MSFLLDVHSFARTIYKGEVDKLILPTTEGEIVVLPSHMPYLTILDLGVVEIITKNESLALTIGKGVFSFDNNKATLLLEDESFIDEITEEGVQKAITKAEELKKQGIKEFDLKASYLMRRSLVDSKLIKKRKRVNL